MDELISKQAAIDTFYELWGTSLTRTVDAIKQLPSSQPEIVRCKNCKRRRTDGYCTRFQVDINGIATPFFMPEEDDFCSKAERKTE